LPVAPSNTSPDVREFVLISETSFPRIEPIVFKP